MRIDATERDFAIMRDYTYVNGVWIYVGDADSDTFVPDLMDVVKAETEANDADV